MEAHKGARLRILLVEDDDHEVVLIQRAVEKAGVGHFAHVVRDGQEAIHYLTGNGAFCDRARFPLPNLIITDLKMPRTDGFQFLRWLRSHSEYDSLPAVMLSNSYIPSDVQQAYRLGANSFFTKPTGFHQFVELLGLIYAYWSHCELPPVLEKRDKGRRSRAALAQNQPA
ncbi:MAG: hypothetical protein C5B50_11575 [Verrucomicrobia bacterium]|nr:MAG: hypothetical protein C5B50_11575 [Verrucomicrobiota bacterium]